jgi:hypothetical protein
LFKEWDEIVQMDVYTTCCVISKRECDPDVFFPFIIKIKSEGNWFVDLICSGHYNSNSTRYIIQLIIQHTSSPESINIKHTIHTIMKHVVLYVP